MNVKSITDEKSIYSCIIELSIEETIAIKNALSRTHCKGNDLDISEKLEDELYIILKMTNVFNKQRN